VARASNPENHPNAKTPPTPSKGYRSDLGSIPAVDVHGRKPNFPGEPNNPGDTINIGQSGENHGWFHS
jgi:hypothetical protein